MIICGIDQSISSSALTIFKDGKLYFYNYTNKKSNYKWIKDTNNLITYSHHNFIYSEDYSESEVDKLACSDELANKIVDTIKEIVGEEEALVYIEGYSYSSNGKLLDLVQFATLIRYKVIYSPNLKLIVVPPSSLKSFMGAMLYEKDKKGVYRNENGKASGSFDKKDMMVALLKLNLNYPYIKYLEQHKDELLASANIPKPFDDINDSLLFVYYGCIKNNIQI